MALFKRADLQAKGFNPEQIEYIMTESGRSLAANYTPTTDVQAQIDAALNAAKVEPVDPKTTPEYLEIVKERDMLRTIGGEDFAGVKPKFREQVFGMLDRGKEAKAVQEQLTGIKEKYEEFFLPQTEQKEQPKNTPQYSQQPGRTSTNPQSEEDKLFEQLKSSWN